MKPTLALTIWLLALVAWATTVQAAYRETMDVHGLTKDLTSDYGLVDDHAEANQSETLQEAIDDVATAGGGRLLLPKVTNSPSIAE